MEAFVPTKKQPGVWMVGYRVLRLGVGLWSENRCSWGAMLEHLCETHLTLATSASVHNTCTLDSAYQETQHKTNPANSQQSLARKCEPSPLSIPILSNQPFINFLYCSLVCCTEAHAAPKQLKCLENITQNA